MAVTQEVQRNTDAMFTKSRLTVYLPDWALTVPNLVDFSIASLDPFHAELSESVARRRILDINPIYIRLLCYVFIADMMDAL